MGTLLAATALLGWRLHTNFATGRSNSAAQISDFGALPLTPTLSPVLADGNHGVLADGHHRGKNPVSAPRPRGGIGRRLSNTTDSLSKLTRSPKAVLLQNALIDTSLPVNLAVPDTLRAPADSGTFIVQSRGPPDAGFRGLLSKAGASIISYIPNNAFLVRASENSALGLRSSALVQSVLPYEPYYKLSPSLVDLAVSNSGLSTDLSALFLNLLLFPDASDRSAIAALAQISSEEPSPFGPILHVEAPAGSLSALAQLSVVQAIEPAARRVPANDLSRRFGDLLGEANQLLAAAATEVFGCVAGIPLRIK